MNAPTNRDLRQATDAYMAASDWLKHANKTGIGKPAAMGQYNRERARFNRIADAIREGRSVRHPERHTADFDADVQGIPCGVAVTWFQPAMDEHECDEMTLVLMDRNGYRADWLEAKCTPIDWGRLEIQAIREHKEAVAEQWAERRIEEHEMECAL